MADTIDTKVASSTVPREPLKHLKHVSEARYNSVVQRAREFQFSHLAAEAMAFHELGILENEALRKLRLLLRAQICFEEAAQQMLEHSKALKDAADALAEHTIVELMDNNELPYLPLAGDRRVVVEEKVHASIKKENMAVGVELLEKRGAGAIVKRTVGVALGTNEGKLADKVNAAIKKALGAKAEEYVVADECSVHHSTLSAWVRRELADGKAMSTEEMAVLGVYHGRKAVIKEPKGGSN